MITWVAEWKIKQVINIDDLNPEIVRKNGKPLIKMRILYFFKIVLTKIRITSQQGKREKNDNLFVYLKDKIIREVNVSVLIQKKENSKSVSLILYKKGFKSKKMVEKLVKTTEYFKGVADFSTYSVCLPKPQILHNFLSKLTENGIIRYAKGRVSTRRDKISEKERKSIRNKNQNFLTSTKFIKNLPSGSCVIYSLDFTTNEIQDINANKNQSDESRYKERTQYKVLMGITLFFPMTRKDVFVQTEEKNVNDDGFYPFARAIAHPSPGKKGTITFKTDLGSVLTPIISLKNVQVKGFRDVINNILENILKLTTLFCKEINTPNLKPSFKTYSDGPIHIGHQIYNGEKISPFSLNIEDLQNHVGIIGRTGCGKSVLAQRIIRKILDSTSTNVWIFDFHGEWVTFAKEKFEVISPGSAEAPLALNILESQANLPTDYANFLSNLLKEVLRVGGRKLSPQMERILASAIEKSIAIKKQSHPLILLQNLWEKVQEMSKEVHSSIKSFQGLINRLETFFGGVAEEVFWVYESNFDVKNLASKNIIFDLSGLSRRGSSKEAHTLLVNVMLKYLLSHFYMAQEFRRKKEHPMFIVLEEARWLIPWQKKESSAETTTTEDFAILSRKYGISLIFINQSWKSLSKAAINNLGSKFVMSGTAPKDFCPYSGDVRDYIQQMPKREAIVDLSDDLEPLHVKVADSPLPSMNPEDYRNYLVKKGNKLRRKYSPIQVSFNQATKLITNGRNTKEIIRYRKKKNLAENTYLCNRETDCKQLSFLKLEIRKICRSYGEKVEEELINAIKTPFSKKLLKKIVERVITYTHLEKRESNCITCGLFNFLIEASKEHLKEERKHEVAYRLSKMVRKSLNLN